MTATGAHISVIGHITEADLKAQLDKVQILNGFGNRFLWVMATRSKSLPFGGNFQIDEVSEIVTEVKKALSWARRERRIEFDADTRRLWPDVYFDLSQSEPGPFGAITDRAEAQVRRIALIYAVMDRSKHVKPVHLNAALEVWRYCEESAAYLFADAPTSPIDGAITRFLEGNAGWISRSQISKRAFKGEVKAYRLTSAFNGLVERGVIEHRRRPTRGRTRDEYRLRQD